MSVLSYDSNERVVTITLNRPEKRNALNGPLRTALSDALKKFESSDDSWIAILAGAGPTFCAGRDLVERVDVGDNVPGPSNAEIYDQIRALSKPIIGAIEGACVAAGAGIALSTDIRIGSETCRFGWPQVKRGVNSVSGPAILSRIVPTNIALEYLYTGRFVSAEESLAQGLVNELVPEGEALTRATELAAEIAGNAPIAVRAMREATLKTAHLRADDAYVMATHIGAQVDASDDKDEGLLAFKEKRSPVWKAR